MGKEKKEIGKLLELLNEYQKENGPEWISFYEKNGYLECQIEHYVSAYGYEDDYRVDMEYGVEILISKSYGFIKWLVENDKIDTSKANDKNLNGYEIELRIRAVKELVADSEEKTVLYLNLLMLLAIQDEPIRFLCDILK